MPRLPNKIVDLHTHLFNARCLPFPGIIANELNKDVANSWTEITAPAALIENAS